ncbi:MAG: hypothetical protein HYT46_02885 [Candidatus Vogelbacteria bacterium]|nr:hypothetical protein [Candidatus Vogelbacteria bacterium]
MYDIAFVVGDIGGALELLFVAECLAREDRKEKVWIKWLADPDGQAKDELRKRGVAFSFTAPGALTEEIDVVVYGVSSTAAYYTNDWIRWAQDNQIPVIGVQDFFGTGNASLKVVAPNVLCVINEAAAKMVRNIYPDPKLMIEVTGKPRAAAAWTTLIRLRDGISERLRWLLAVPSDNLLAVYWSDGNPARIEEQLHALVAVSPDKIHWVNWVCRFHPKLLDEESPDHLVIAADLNICSGEAVESLLSVLADRPTIIIGDCPNGVLPHIATELAVPASSIDRLKELLVIIRARDWENLQDFTPSRRSSSHGEFCRQIVDSNATRRVAEIILAKCRC